VPNVRLSPIALTAAPAPLSAAAAALVAVPVTPTS
jgi:hypothetical protein